MRDDPVRASSSATARDLSEIMYREDVGSVIVTVRGEPVGIVTDRDIVTRGVALQKDPAAMTAKELMTPDPCTVDADSGVFEAIETACGEGIRRLPVTGEDGTLEGIVTLDDLSTLLSDEFRNLTDVIRQESPPC